jgi:hypothetical protein
MKSPRTRSEYLARFAALWRRSADSRKFDSPDLLDPVEFAGDLVAEFALLRPASRRFYRSACIYGMAQRAANGGGQSSRWAEAIQMLKGAVVAPAARLAAATSSSKLKLLTATDFEAIQRQITLRDLSHGESLAAFLVAGIVTGLRPIEWAHARLVRREGCVALVVRNAKYRPGERAHGRFRRLLWNADDAVEITAIERYLAIVTERLRGAPMAERRDLLETFNRALGATLRLVCISLWPRRRRRYALYSARHTAAARLKASGMSLAEVAAALGHLSDETAIANYAQPPRGAGRRLPHFVGPTAHPRDVARVRAVAGPWRDIVEDARERAHAGPRR